MSESKTVTVPLEISPPQPQPAAEKPSWARKSLHNVRMPRQEVQAEPQWVMNGPNPEIRWEPVQQATDILPMGIAENQPNIPQVNFMDNQSNGNQQQAPQRPDPAHFDFYDPQSAAEYNAQNDAYMESVVQRQVASALQPHMASLNEAALQRDYNAAVARYGQDENFKECMEVALQNCGDLNKAGKPFNILEQYQAANDASAARPGQRGNAHLPESLRTGKKAINSLGKIMFHNAQTGRARPFNGRNWRG